MSRLLQSLGENSPHLHSLPAIPHGRPITEDKTHIQRPHE
ncbi:hypothetical protein E2C01_077988 [Portunus trituberculatus]|uniref:Uncharacterized protein n=1 Tax=Portunus trituberculatus TaxID=210409 RepID=A0A5B7ICT2_PORTR|nr:hypothetical protein [Portunus trituberculatus]